MVKICPHLGGASYLSIMLFYSRSWAALSVLVWHPRLLLWMSSMCTQVPVALGHILEIRLLFIIDFAWNLAVYLEQPGKSRGNDCCLPTRWFLATSTIQNIFGRPKKCSKAELKDFKGRFSPPPPSGFLMCNRCWHIFVHLTFLVLEGTGHVGFRALFSLPMLLLFAGKTIVFGWCLRIPSGSEADCSVTDKLFFRERLFITLPVHVRLPFCSVHLQTASAAFSGLITDKAQLFDMYQLRVKQKPRPKSQITRGRRMLPNQPVSYQPIGS